MKVTISKTNSKLGLIPSINLPPILTCRTSCPCAKDCYALKGRFRFPNVRESMRNNLDIYESDPDFYFKSIRYEIDNKTVSHKYFRWHAAGDIVDEKYFDGMIKLANELSATRFLAFTKKYDIINNYVKLGGIIPSNLNIVFSAWGSALKVDNPYNFPVAYVMFHDEMLTGYIPEEAEKCFGDCTNCLKCWNIKRGQSVVFSKH